MLGTPRLLQLLVDGALPVGDAVLVARTLGEAGWEPNVRTQIHAVMDAWWYEVLRLEVGEHEPNVSGQRFIPAVGLGILAQYSSHTPAPHSVAMGRWLDVWRESLDGAGAVHLAAAIVPGATEAGWVDGAWEGLVDPREQFLAWARSEPIINGLTLIGGTHISLHAVSNPDAPDLGDVLDHLL